MTQQKVWFITGVSRGLGKSIAEAALKAGDLVVGTTRTGASDLATSPNLRVLPLDVTDEGAVFAAVEKATSAFGRLDVVVNNAGYSILGAVEEISLKEAHDQFETCFFGALSVVRAALPILCKQQSGQIINITSVAGAAPTASAVVYAASKFALEGLSEGLAQEVASFGIKVTIVEPGAFRTDFLNEKSVKYANSLPAYAESVAKAREKFNAMNGKQRGNPAKAAERIVELSRDENPPLHLILGPDAYDRIEKKLTSRIDEMKRLKSITDSTDF